MWKNITVFEKIYFIIQYTKLLKKKVFEIYKADLKMEKIKLKVLKIFHIEFKQYLWQGLW
jgi:hypothetical protein